jgi:hypothetical protein
MKSTFIKMLSLLLLTGTAAISAAVAWARTTIVDGSGISHHLVQLADMERECITTDRSILAEPAAPLLFPDHYNSLSIWGSR